MSIQFAEMQRTNKMEISNFRTKDGEYQSHLPKGQTDIHSDS